MRLWSSTFTLLPARLKDRVLPDMMAGRNEKQWTPAARRHGFQSIRRAAHSQQTTAYRSPLMNTTVLPDVRAGYARTDLNTHRPVRGLLGHRCRHCDRRCPRTGCVFYRNAEAYLHSNRGRPSAPCAVRNGRAEPYPETVDLRWS